MPPCIFGNEMKELYLYSGINDYSAEVVVAALEENMGEEVLLRLNSPGGMVFANNGICAKIVEHKDVTIRVDGTAMSCAFDLLLYAKKAECNNLSKFMMHKAIMYGATESEQAFVDNVNKDRRKQMEARMDAAKFKLVTGYTIKELFENEPRLDIYLDAKQAKQLGLVQKINNLSATEVKAMNDGIYGIAASATGPATATQTSVKQNTNMTVAELTAAHPALVAAIADEAIRVERDRVGALLAYMHIDAATVTPLIKEGKPLTQTLMAELGLKALSGQALVAVAGENAPVVATAAKPVNDKTEVVATDKQKELEAFRNNLKAHREKNPQ